MEVDFLNHTEPKTLDDLRDYEKLYCTTGILIIQLRNYNCIFIFHSTHTLHLFALYNFVEEWSLWYGCTVGVLPDTCSLF